MAIHHQQSAGWEEARIGGKLAEQRAAVVVPHIVFGRPSVRRTVAVMSLSQG